MSAFLWAVVTACVWGVVPLMEKAGIGGLPATTGVIIRSVGVVVGLVVCSALWSPWGALRSAGWPSILWLAGGGLLASFVGQMAFYQALKSGHLSQITPVAGAYPLITALLGWWLLREPVTATRVAGVLCIIAGVALLRR